MVYNHTLTFVTVFIWRDLFFGYKLVTNWLHQTSLRLHSHQLEISYRYPIHK